MNKKIAFFLPVRKGSERVRDKNTRPFAGNEDGLLGNKIAQLVGCHRIDEIIVSTNDPDCIGVAMKFSDARIRVDRRPERLCTSETNLQDLIAYVPSVSEADVLVWGHVTTPFADAECYDDAVDQYLAALDKGFDSLIGVREVHNFFLDKTGRIINNSSPLAWPRTQDLDPLYEVNHTVFIAGREIYEKKRNRTGDHPYLHTMSPLESFDIDWEDDFAMAEMMANGIRNLGG